MPSIEAIHALLDFCNGRQDLFERGGGVEDHGGCAGVVPCERAGHRGGRREHKCTGLCGGEVVVGPVEEHPGVVDAIGTQLPIGERRFASNRAKEAMVRRPCREGFVLQALLG